MTKNFYQAVKERRSIYSITKEPIVSDEQLQEIIELAVVGTPSAFNSQTGRVVLLLNEQSDKFWNYVFESLKKDLPSEKIESTRNRIDGFAAGYGTALFFEDEAVVESFQEKFASLKDLFPDWSQQASGILQYIVWTALEQEGYGASLQHYVPEIPQDVKAAWGIQDQWKFIAQIPFGKSNGAPRDKEIIPVEQRVVIAK